MVIDEILAHNEQFVQQTALPLIGHAPQKRMAVVTCMDCRLVTMFEQALGLERGDVLELRTAGATISRPERAGAASDLIRSLAGGIYLLSVREVVDAIRNSPFLPKIPVHGLVINIETGKLEMIDRG